MARKYDSKIRISCYIVPGIYPMINNAKRISCEVCGISLSELTSHTRKINILFARYIAMKLLSDYTIISLQHIGGLLFDNPSVDKHATVIHGIRTVDTAIAQHKKGFVDVLYNKYIVADIKMRELYDRKHLSASDKQYERVNK